MRTYLLTTVFVSQALLACEVEVSDAVVREPIAGRTMTAGFMTLNNHSDKDAALVSAKAPWAGAIELHAHLHEDGVMRMREVDSVPVAAGASQRLQSGGYHLMLMDLTLPLPANPSMTLCFDNGHCVEQAFAVEAMR